MIDRIMIPLDQSASMPSDYNGVKLPIPNPNIGSIIQIEGFGDLLRKSSTNGGTAIAPIVDGALISFIDLD